MELIDLYNVVSKDEAVEVCNEHGMTVREAVINNLDIMIDGLTDIKKKVSSDMLLENEDWMAVALPIRNMMNVLSNHWYQED